MVEDKYQGSHANIVNILKSEQSIVKQKNKSKQWFSLSLYPLCLSSIPDFGVLVKLWSGAPLRGAILRRTEQLLYLPPSLKAPSKHSTTPTFSEWLLMVNIYQLCCDAYFLKILYFHDTYFSAFYAYFLQLCSWKKRALIARLHCCLCWYGLQTFIRSERQLTGNGCGRAIYLHPYMLLE